MSRVTLFLCVWQLVHCAEPHHIQYHMWHLISYSVQLSVLLRCVGYSVTIQATALD